MYDADVSARTPRPFATFDRLESKVRSYSRTFPAVFNRASGSWLYDDAGSAYLDFLSGCASLNYGHNHPALKARLIEYMAADGVAHSLDMHSVAKAEFLEAFEARILRPRGLNYRVQFTGPTGANAVEAALKLARKITGRTNVIAFTNGFHGVTLGALAATGNAHHRGGGGLPALGVTHAAFDGYFSDDADTAAQLDQMLSDPSSGVDRPAAIIVETVQGEGGLNVASGAWLRAIERIARRHEALLIIDDIQAGCGRTGTFFSFEGAGIKPDIITMAKSLSGLGLPMALTLMKPEHDVWKPGEHNGTFRGNCHAFITAAAALDTFWADDSFAAEVRRKGEHLGERLSQIASRNRLIASGVRGRGMMRGLEVGGADVSSRIVQAAFAQGLVIETSGARDQVVKVLAPLTISDADLDHGLDILAAAVAVASTHAAAQPRA
ncbi:diaminobutyrate--2-oxoglutarate transaminase [Phenylobacterium sp.]|uniref:diaminobutyrate--2-oxoglutarate transaminase n=1 Tax=Phenylobacterium sp. TaxID=1871053 RepID=UPI00272F3689|nr:diaminobutyrate--2-oxoglutarate transaminase [Phenylobacterium sp.]MDP1601046.1 diaminobutyrate--2-oxoglutarate transaminase [Phenylobacterium sp.]MDP3594582.1 diaminobutyrate--2-oxoglutarate transaminase [Phenylobacterium sp.]